MDPRIETLKAKHAELDKQISDLENQPKPDDITIHELKKQKLRVKDEIARLSGTH
ncbi:MAG: YdcH family protein [Alphaproteobacteria bacterium]